MNQQQIKQMGALSKEPDKCAVLQTTVSVVQSTVHSPG